MVSPEHTQALAADWNGVTPQPLTEDTYLLGEGLEISFSDSPTGWDAAIHWNETSLLLTGSKQSATQQEWDVLLLTGTVYGEYEEMGEVLVLTKPWQIESPAWSIPVYRTQGSLHWWEQGLGYLESG